MSSPIPATKTSSDRRGAPARALAGPPSFVPVTVGDPVSAPGGDIPPGTTFQKGNWAISSDEVYVLIFQTDGNLVLYQVIGAPPAPGGSFTGYAMWSTATFYGPNPGTSFAVQTDGNLVVYGAGGTVAWQSYTSAPPRCLSVQTDGNLVLYATSGDATWSSGTFLDLPALLPNIQQGDTGVFEAKTIAWHHLDGDGDNGETPTITKLDGSMLEIDGGYDVDDWVIGKGSGTIHLGVYLTGPATCVVDVQASGPALGYSFTASGTWYASTNDDGPVVQLDLSDGNSVTLSTYSDGVGFQVNDGYQLAFVDESAQLRAGKDPRRGKRAVTAPPARRGASSGGRRLRALREHLVQLAGRGAGGGVLDLPLRRVPEADAAAPIGAPAWRRWYGRLLRGPRAALPSLAEIEARAARHREAGCVPIAVAHVRCETPSPALAEAAARFARGAGPLPSLSAATSAVLEERTVLRAAPLPKEEYVVLRRLPYRHPGLTVRYVVPSDLVIGNAGPLAAIEVDFGDGAGFRGVALDAPIDVTYAAPGDHAIRVRARAGTARVGATTQLAVTDATPPNPSEVWALGSPISYEGVTATGFAFVFYGSGNTALTRPLIMAEGFPGGYSLATLWNIFNEQGLAESLLGQGYDLVLLAFDDGTTFVEANAGVMIAAIQRAIAETSPATPLIVGGASMGGLVARYALAYMEANGLPHQTKTYVSYDTPHLGANVPLGVQGLVRLINDFDPGAIPGKVTSLLACNAAQEMLIAWLDPSGDGSGSTLSPLRQALIKNLAAIGSFPAQPTLLGVSNGATDGTGNGTPAGSAVLTDDDSFFTCTLSTSPGIDDTTNDVDLEVCYLTLLGNSGYEAWAAPVADFDSAPGGTETFFSTVASALQGNSLSPQVSSSIGCFVPTISALSMSSLSVYDDAQLTGSVAGVPSDLDAWTGSNNDPHVTITSATAAWLLDHLAAGGAQARARRRR